MMNEKHDAPYYWRYVFGNFERGWSNNKVAPTDTNIEAGPKKELVSVTHPNRSNCCLFWMILSIILMCFTIFSIIHILLNNRSSQEGY